MAAITRIIRAELTGQSVPDAAAVDPARQRNVDGRRSYASDCRKSSLTHVYRNRRQLTWQPRQARSSVSFQKKVSGSSSPTTTRRSKFSTPHARRIRSTRREGQNVTFDVGVKGPRAENVRRLVGTDSAIEKRPMRTPHRAFRPRLRRLVRVGATLLAASRASPVRCSAKMPDQWRHHEAPINASAAAI
jgi:hypothetical protein